MRQKPAREPSSERIKNFSEVTRVFSRQEAFEEASRCLQCKNAPCGKGCPVNIDIPAFIKFIKDGLPAEALAKIKERNSLPGICGRVCPQEEQCEKACVLNKKGEPVNIGALERFAADSAACAKTSPVIKEEKKTSPALSAAVIGSGPAGLTCAAELAKLGYKVELFESLHLPGGVLSYGIPEFRLPKKIVAEEVAYVLGLGVKVSTDTLAGYTVSLEELTGKRGFFAVFIASGAGLPQFLGIKGENLPGVYSANEFLCRINLMKAYEFPVSATPVIVENETIVIGGGNVALDCARCARRLGSRVSLIYRRTETEMPARREEVENAREEGINFCFLTQPLEFLSDPRGLLSGVKCLKMELGEPDDSGRRKPLALPGSEFRLNAGTAVVAVGQNPNPLLARACPGLKTGPRGTLAVDDNLMTSIPGIFAGGDIVSGAATVISAMAAGKKGAAAIDAYLKELKHQARSMKDEK
ncbi:MAG: NADPH-dependent glutamate synthase [Candidatus Omnitrophota bacterium]